MRREERRGEDTSTRTRVKNFNSRIHDANRYYFEERTTILQSSDVINGICRSIQSTEM